MKLSPLAGTISPEVAPAVVRSILAAKTEVELIADTQQISDVLQNVTLTLVFRVRGRLTGRRGKSTLGAQPLV